VKSRSLVALGFLVLTFTLQGEPCRRGYQVAEHAVTTFLPASLTTGDFDEDGRGDFVVKILYDDVYLLLNRGDEVFEPLRLDRQAGINESFLPKSFDVTGDGHIDLIVQRYEGVSVYPGRGDGTFGARVNSSLTGIQPRQADFNGDGLLDLFGVNDGVVTVAVARADAMFQQAAPQFFQEKWSWDNPFTLGDFDGDGRPDAVNLGFEHATKTAQAHFLWNRGDLTFGEQLIVLPATLAWAELRALDVEGDGTQELVSINGDVLTVVRVVGRVLTVEAIPLTEPLTGFTPVGTGDLDYDGRQDAIFQNNSAAGILWGRAPGEQTYSVSVFDLPLAAIAIADVNGDRVDDVVSISAEGIATLYGERSSRNLRAAPLSPVVGAVARMLEADFDGDGRTDLITSSVDSNAYDTTVLQGGADLRFRHRTTITGARTVGVGDLDGDGQVDLVTQPRADVPATAVRFGSGWTFGEPVTISSTARFIGVGAMAGGGKAVLLNDGGAIVSVSLASRTAVATTLATVVASLRTFVVDVDGDGDSDVVALDTAGAGRVLTQSANGWTSDRVTLPIDSVTEVQAADLDGDGRTDLVARNEHYFSVSVAKGDGTYIRMLPTVDATGFLQSLRLSDVDRDGHPDVILISKGNSGDPNVVQIQRNTGNGSTEGYGTFLIGPTDSGAAVVSDVDKDGWEDLIVGTYTGTAVLRNICTTPRVRVAALPAVAREGDSIKLVVHALPTHFFSVGLITIREGGAVLHMHQPNLAFDFATLTYELPPLSVGRHELTVEYRDQYAGISSTTVTVHVVPRTVRRRAVR
jgi:hypothetical protein